jgi:hypothetical protein
MNGEKTRAVETQGAVPVLAVSDGYQGEAAFLGATQEVSERAPGSLRRETAAAWAACGAFERAAFAYFGVSSVLIVLFAEHLRHPLRLLGVRAMVVCVVLLLCRIQARSAERCRAEGESSAGLWWHFWRHWYPHLFFLFCFEELAQLMTLVTPKWCASFDLAGTVCDAGAE